MIFWDEIVSIEEVEEDICYDITLLETDDLYLNEPNFIAENIVVHNCGMHEQYVNRKRGKESYELHPLLKPILEKTYGVICFQEDLMKILHVVGDIPLKDCEMVRKAISKKKREIFEKYEKMFIENGQKNLGLSEQEVLKLWKTVEAFAEYGFNLSHAVAYTYLSMQLLCLKKHYPLEFYTAILSCEKLSEKIKEYKMEAKLHDIELQSLNIHKSRETFDLTDDQIYIGFSNIKGIGLEPAKRIVAGQPYKSFEDFLERFGTEAKILKPLISLKCFPDADPITLWKFADYFKNCYKKQKSRQKAYEKSLDKYETQFQEYTGLTTKLSEIKPFSDEFWAEYDKEIFIEKKVKGVLKTLKKNVLKEVKKLQDRRATCLQKIKDNENIKLPKLASFNPNAHTLDKSIRAELNNLPKCEEKYYGFRWVHALESSPDRKGGLTFAACRHNFEHDIHPVEVQIKKVTRKQGKKASYNLIEASDENDETGQIIIWDDDWERWGEEIKPGKLLRMKVKAPSGGFKTYMFDSPPKHLRWKLVPKDKDKDYRLAVMEAGKVPELRPEMTNEEALEQFLDCVGE